MINELAGIGYGIITLAVIIAIGMTIVLAMGNNSGAGLGNTSLYTLAGYLGNGTGGLVTWVPLIITFVVGMWFLGAMMVRKGSNS